MMQKEKYQAITKALHTMPSAETKLLAILMKLFLEKMNTMMTY